MPSANPLALDRVANFRRVGAGIPSLRTGLIWRTGDLSMASPEDVTKLHGAVGGGTLLDLRSDYSEYESACLQRPVFTSCLKRVANYPISEGMLNHGGLGGGPAENVAAGEAAETEEIPDEILAFRNRTADAGAMMSTPEGMTDFMVDFNITMLKCNTPILLAALREMLQPENFPIVIGCMHGKDRTGLFAALVLEALGISRDTIMADYMVSAAAADMQLEMDGLRRQDGATGMAAGGAPRSEKATNAAATALPKAKRSARSHVFPEVLERTMAWVDAQARTNGGGEDGVVGWLASIGFGSAEVSSPLALSSRLCLFPFLPSYLELLACPLCVWRSSLHRTGGSLEGNTARHGTDDDNDEQ